MIPLLVELLAGGASAVHAQEATTLRATRPGVLGFSYGWDGGIVMGDEGIRMTQPPKVGAVRDDTPAAAAGLRTGDVIVSANGRDARDPAVLRDIGPAEKVALVVLRNGAQHRLEFTTAKRPER